MIFYQRHNTKSAILITTASIWVLKYQIQWDMQANIPKHLWKLESHNFKLQNFIFWFLEWKRTRSTHLIIKQSTGVKHSSMQFFWIAHIKRNSQEFESLNLGSHLFFYEFWKFIDPTKLAETFSIKKNVSRARSEPDLGQASSGRPSPLGRTASWSNRPTGCGDPCLPSRIPVMHTIHDPRKTVMNPHNRVGITKYIIHYINSRKVLHGHLVECHSGQVH
jgi:hypothetical protein